MGKGGGRKGSTLTAPSLIATSKSQGVALVEGVLHWKTKTNPEETDFVNHEHKTQTMNENSKIKSASTIVCS